MEWVWQAWQAIDFWKLLTILTAAFVAYVAYQQQYKLGGERLVWTGTKSYVTSLRTGGMSGSSWIGGKGSGASPMTRLLESRGDAWSDAIAASPP
jgi:hypothetical protein